MKAVTVRFHAQSRLTLALVLLVALALAFLPARTLLAAPDATAGQSVATPTPTAAGHAGMSESPAHAADASQGEKPMTGEMPMTAVDDHAPAAPTVSAGHADEPAHESAAAHGHEDEAPATATATRGLVLGGFGAVNGLVIVGAAIAKTRTGNKAKARRVSPSDTTTKGAAQ